MNEPMQGSHVQLRDLRKSFGGTTVLQGIDLELRPGAFVAVVGKSGCGKSTLLRLIAGLTTPSGGTLTVNGQPLRGHNVAARVMFQDARLLPWQRVLENVGLGVPHPWTGRAEDALRQVGLLARAGEWPAVLSGGERQRVALARALIHAPPLLLLDEPLGALDALTRIEMQGLVERVWQERRFTTMLVTHDVEEAVVLADRVILIEHGRIALDMRVDVPRPRSRGSAELAALKQTILSRVMHWEAAGVPGGSAPVERRAHA